MVRLPGTISHQLQVVNQKIECVLERLANIERLLVNRAVEPDRWYSRKEAADLLGVSPRTVDRHVADTCNRYDVANMP